MKKNSLKHKVLFYLAIFTFVIIGGLWFLQILSLGTYYELSKTSTIEKIAKKVYDSYDDKDYKDILDNLAFEDDVCIEITNKYNIYYSTDSVSRGCLINNSESINKFKLNFMKSNNTSLTYKVINPRFKNKTLIHGIKLDKDVFAFISTSLEPIGSTVSVLKTQLIYITIIVLVIAVIIAFVISKKISDPIEKITNNSKLISKGKYNTNFKSGTDIEEIKVLEETLNGMAIELSKTESLRREFLANVSHDLKTPLTLIKANAEMVKDLTYKNKEKREKNLDTIISEVDRLNLLVEDILDLSKMQTVEKKLDIEKFNLNELAKSIINKFDILKNDGYIIEYEGFDVFIKADKKKIEQVIYNLINNAVNYTGDSKKVYVKLINVDDNVKLEVIDTGIGIDKEDLNYIWDKYYKVDKKYRRVSYGSGLGLSIVKNILYLHGFKYGVESKKNIGTKFYFLVKKQKM